MIKILSSERYVAMKRYEDNLVRQILDLQQEVWRLQEEVEEVKRKAPGATFAEVKTESLALNEDLQHHLVGRIVDELSPMLREDMVRMLMQIARDLTREDHSVMYLAQDMRDGMGYCEFTFGPYTTGLKYIRM